jgi:branched-chain amino acid transport system permease protein
VIAGTVAGIAGALFAYLKGSVFPDSLGISLSVDALVMVLLGGVETVSGAVIGAIVYKALSIWLVSQTDLSKLVLGGVIVLIVVAFPKGIVGILETIRNRRRTESPKSALLGSRIEIAE